MFTNKGKIFRVSLTVLAAGALAAAGSSYLVNANSVPLCNAQQLTGTPGATDEAMGHRQVAYTLTNTSDSTCFVQGAPTTVNEVFLFDGTSPSTPIQTEVGDTYFTPNGTDIPITLEPGASARGVIAWSTPDQPRRETYTLKIDLPEVGTIDTGYHNEEGARDGHYTVTNLEPTA